VREVRAHESAGDQVACSPFAAGWNRFLTERDRRLLSATPWAKREPFGLGERPALVIVDAYYGALGLPRAPILEAVQRWPSACGSDGWDAIDRTVPVLEAARESGTPVVFLTGLAVDSSPWNRKKRAARVGAADGFLRIVEELEPHGTDFVLEKCSPSAFATTGLDVLLRSRGCDTILLCGETTSGCIRTTAVDACTRGYAVAVVGDCCFDRFEASHWLSLFDLEQKYSDVVTADQAVQTLGGPAARPCHADAEGNQSTDRRRISDQCREKNFDREDLPVGDG
jgi:maleamate amidohydrolase